MKNIIARFFLFVAVTSCQNWFGQVIYNAYARVTTVTNSTLLAVSNPNETNHTFTVGGQVIVMQMQDDVIGTNTTNATTFGNLGSIANAGRYEVRTISAVNRSAGTATSIGLSAALSNTYNTGSNSRVQVITFRRLSSAAFTTTNSITGLTWDGNVGGVIALEIGTDFRLSHSITANGIGFRGGAVSSNYYGGVATCTTLTPVTSSTRCAVKGEGIFAVTSATQTRGTAKVLNGGGGGGQDINGGGGGGSNYTSGGNGGPGWNGSPGGCSPSAAGTGGISLSASIGASRVFMGGGGGGGQQNDGVGSAGANGGGIILLKANRLITGGCSFNPTITANGNTASNATNDGAGGGGGAGSIVLQIATYSVSAACPLVVRANGGNGGNSNTADVHGGGGAGAQGVVIYSIAQPTTNITTQTNNGTPGCNNSGCSSSGGTAGGSNNSGIVASASGVLPISLLYFKVENQINSVSLNWATASEINTDYFVIERSTDGYYWHEVVRKKATENSSFRQYYSAEDLEPVQGLTYYKLTTVDKDQTKSSAPLMAIDRQNLSPLVYYPNPASSELHVLSHTPINTLKFSLKDYRGLSLKISIKEMENNRLTLDVSDLSEGVYFMEAYNDFGFKQITKIIIR